MYNLEKIASDLVDKLEKLAMASKARKVYNSGRLPAEVAEKLFEPTPILNNLHNRINARAQRAKHNQLPKGEPTASKYKRFSKVDNLPSKAPLDIRRETKYWGKENSKVIGELRKKTDNNVKIVKLDDPLDGYSGLVFDHYSNILKSEIGIPNPKYIDTSVGKRVSKEFRSLISRHEISGEAKSGLKTLNALKGADYNSTSGNYGAFSFSSHRNPEVLLGDGQMLKKFSPKSQDYWTNFRRNISSDFNYGSDSLSENGFMKALMGKRPLSNPSEPWFRTKNLDRKLDKVLQNMADIKGVPKDIVESYLKQK